MKTITDYDVAILGGGPGGSSAAIHLSGMGYKVIVLEKEKFPRDHVGESLIPFCYYQLEELGVLENIKSFATKKPGVNFVDRDGKKQSVWCFDKVIKDGAELSFHSLRAPFDHAMLKRASACGAVVREEITVKDVDLSKEDIVYIRTISNDNKEQIITSRFLIDASGQHSFLGKKLNVKKAYEGLDRVAFFTHWIKTKYDDALNAGLIKIVYLGGEKKGWLWVIPVGRNHLSIGVTLNNSYVREQKKKFTGENWKEELYRSEVAEAIALHPILAEASIEHDVQVLGDYSYRIDKKYGANFAMVGDAGAFLDPIFSSGIYVAMETSKRVCQSIHEKFKNGNEAGEISFEKNFADIDAGYQLIEKFVRLFYDPELIKFTDLGSEDGGYNRFLSAYEIFHYLLAGDFFSDHKKYMGFLEDLNKERSYNRFIHYVKTKANEFPDREVCHHNFENIYGHLPMTDKVAPGLLKK